MPASGEVVERTRGVLDDLAVELDDEALVGRPLTALRPPAMESRAEDVVRVADPLEGAPWSSRRMSLSVDYRPGVRGRRPLVLCGGIGTGRQLFGPLLEVLDPDRPVILFDPPGIGVTPAPRWPYTYSWLAAEVRRLVEDLGHAEVDVLGISWGGGLAQQYALQYPSHCRRLVLVATGTGVLMVPAGPRTLISMLSPRRHRDPELAREIAGNLYGGTARRRPDAAVEAVLRGGATPTARGYLCQLLAIATWTSLPILPWIRQPALVLAGNDDPIIPAANGPILAGGLADGRLHRYEGGHLALLTEAPVLAPIIEQFLDQPTPPVAPGTPSAPDWMPGLDREAG